MIPNRRPVAAAFVLALGIVAAAALLAYFGPYQSCVRAGIAYADTLEPNYAYVTQYGTSFDYGHDGTERRRMFELRCAMKGGQ
jgi:hypothetical protein